LTNVRETHHRTHYDDARDMGALTEASVDLVVTSPPYPMIKMWDAHFVGLDPTIAGHLQHGRPHEMFVRMHALLEPVWDEVYRVLRPGGFACINIGDAVRSFDGTFGLYANHARLLDYLQRIGFTCLPAIIWRKPSNAPTKFMGSGMLPAGAYVTLEHEYILIVRKGGKRRFTPPEQQLRRESAIFWEERNIFFSDVWTDIRGTGQSLRREGARRRSAAFPLELALRLILMYAIKGDTVLDPFWGTGTTTLAAAAVARNSIGYEIAPGLGRLEDRLDDATLDTLQGLLRQRFDRHAEFVRSWTTQKGPLKYCNRHYDIAVMTRQEQDLFIDVPCQLRAASPDEMTVIYDDTSLAWVQADRGSRLRRRVAARPSTDAAPAKTKGQLKLF
jgi:DNA modification methylase